MIYIYKNPELQEDVSSQTETQAYLANDCWTEFNETLIDKLEHGSKHKIAHIKILVIFWPRPTLWILKLLHNILIYNLHHFKVTFALAGVWRKQSWAKSRTDSPLTLAANIFQNYQFFAVLGLELRASHLLGRWSTTWAILPALKTTSFWNNQLNGYILFKLSKGRALF
jgi:hypothetical protein